MAGNSAVSSLVQLRNSALPKPLTVQRDDGDSTVTQLSGYYECEEDLSNGERQLTALFINVNGQSIVGTYRRFLRQPYALDEAGDLRGERVSAGEAIRYEVSSDAGSWTLAFDVPATNGSIRGTLPLVVTDSDGQSRDFNRMGDEGPITAGHVRDAPTGRGAELEDERRQGLTPSMLEELEHQAETLLTQLRDRPPALRSQHEVIYRDIAGAHERALARFRGELRERAEYYLMHLLALQRVYFLGNWMLADEAVREALGTSQGPGVGDQSGGGATFSYEVIFRGIRGSGGTLVGGQLASGSVEVRAYRASTSESCAEIAWTRFYHFVEIRVSAVAGGGISGGVYWETFHASSPVEWSQADFGNAEIYIFGLQGPHLEASAGFGPLSRSGTCTSYQFEGVSLTTPGKHLDLQSEERVFHCSSDLPLDSEGGSIDGSILSEEERGEGSEGVDFDRGIGQLESGIGHIEALPSVEYSSERQQFARPVIPGPVDVVPSSVSGGFARASSSIDHRLVVEITARLGEYQQLLQDLAVPVRIIGHASSYWAGHGDPIAGNQSLSRERAERAAELIREAFELPEDRIDVVAFGDRLAREAGGTVHDDDPAFRRFDVLIEGHRTIPIYY